MVLIVLCRIGTISTNSNPTTPTTPRLQPFTFFDLASGEPAVTITDDYSQR